MLLICDPRHPVGIGGVMGGRDTEVTATTRSVLLESAFFLPKSVRSTARKLGLHTDASHRFERGTDFALALQANDRACHLIAELTGGSVRAGCLDVRSEEHLPRPRQVALEPRKLVAFAGAGIALESASRWLRGLGFAVDQRDPERWLVQAPTWRHYDVELPADLYEEVIRHYGYDRVPATLPALAGADAPELPAHKRRRVVRSHLVACGFTEAIDWSFHAPESDAAFPRLAPGDGRPVRLANPLSERYAVMRRSLLPGLYESALYNLRRDAEEVRIFEIGHLFGTGGEVEAVGLIAGGRRGSPWQARTELDLFHMKGVLESLSELFRIELEARPAALPGLLAGATAELVGTHGGEQKRLGYFGRLDQEGLPYPLFAAEMLMADLGSDAVLRGVGLHPTAPPSRFPGIGVDLTLTHALALSWRELELAIEERRSEALTALQTYELKDRYSGPGVPAGAVNTTIGFLYGSPERSLTQEEVNEQHAALAGFLEQRFRWRA
jgi:phenylalanyl-tRNA synthetase beta chain